MLRKQITIKLLIAGMIFNALTACHTRSRQPVHESGSRADSVSAPLIVKARQPVVHHLADLPAPKKHVVSQFLPPRKIPAGFFVPMKNFNTGEGLAMSSVLCGFKDHRCILWFGTSGNGVSRYDGRKFVNFSSSNGLIHNLINCITEDHRGNIWFGTYGGVSVYDGRRFINYTTGQGLLNNDINKILEDRDGNVWIASVKGLNLVEASDANSERVKFIDFTAEHGLQDIYVFDILQGKNGMLWFASEKGVFRFDPGQSETFVNISQTAGLENQVVVTMAEDHEGILWFGTTNGVIRFDPAGHDALQHFSTTDGLVNNDIRCIYTCSDDDIWFGTSGGVSAYNKKEHAFFNLTTAEGLSHNIVCSITEDRTGSLWFGTLGGGLCRYDGKSIIGFTEKQGLPQTVVYAITEDKNGNLWFGGNDHGIIELDSGSITRQKKSFINYSIKQGLPDDYILALLTDRHDNLWMGAPGGLYKFEKTSFVEYSTLQGLVKDYVVSLYEDHRGNLWIGTYEGGISKFDGRTFTNFTTSQGLVHNTVWDILEDEKGILWFATRGGLSIYNGKYFINFTIKQGLPDNKLSSILKDRSGNILIGSWGGGISVIRKNIVDQLTDPEAPTVSEPVFENYSVNDGLSNNVVYNILEDSSGNIFIGSNEGITVLKGGLAPSGKKLAKYGLENYNQKTGFPIKDISNNNSIFLDSRSMIWAGTGDKLVRFDYNRVHRNHKAVNVIFEDVKVNNETVPWYSLQRARNGSRSSGGFSNYIPAYENDELLMYGRVLSNSFRDTLIRKFSNIRFDSIIPFQYIPHHLVLPYAFNSISFDFVGVETRRPFLVKYQYRLKGDNDAWSQPSTESTAVFGNLPPGDYTFFAKAKSPDGVWSEPVAFGFKIMPPWYRTWPAFLFYGLLLIFGIYLIDRVQRRRVIARERQRAMKRELEQAKEIEKSYLELKVAQDQLIQSEKMASLGELAAGIAHEIQNPLNFVNNFSEVSTELVQEIIEAIDNGNLEEVREISADLMQNLTIINQHGQRASSIVKGMLEHSRTSKGEKRPVDINALADEFLRLSYHGLRVKDKSFNANFKMHADKTLPKVNVVPQDIGRVLLNLINNAFYAVHEKNLAGRRPTAAMGALSEADAGESYKPEVVVSTKNLGDKIEISIRDNGPGIPDEIKDKIFQPFFTTKPAGQGTGLGLSMSYEIIIKGHGGSLEAESTAGEGTEFIIYLPVKPST